MKLKHWNNSFLNSIIFTFSLLIVNLSCKSSLSKKPKDEIQVKFLSDSINIYEALEDLQGAVYESNPHLYRWTNSDKEIEKVRNFYQEKGLSIQESDSMITEVFFKQKLPTRYENPNTYILLKGIKDKVEKYVNNIDTEVNLSSGIVTLPYWHLNALTYNNRNKDDPNVIVANQGLFNFSHEMIKILLKTIDIQEGEIQFSNEIFAEKIYQNPYLIMDFSKALEDYSNNRVIRGVEYTEMEKLFIPFLVDAMEVFTISHEYGHLYFNHQKKGDQKLRLKVDEESQLTIEYSNRDWEQELSADIFGTLMLTKYFDKNPIEEEFYPLIHWTPTLFFKLSEVAQESKHIFKAKERIPKKNKLQLKQDYNLSKRLISEILTEDSNLFSNIRFSDTLYNSLQSDYQTLKNSHPPDNVRAKITKNIHFLNKKDYTDSGFYYLGEQLTRNLDLIWHVVKKLHENSLDFEEGIINKKDDDLLIKLLDSIKQSDYKIKKGNASIDSKSYIKEMSESLKAKLTQSIPKAKREKFSRLFDSILSESFKPRDSMLIYLENKAYQARENKKLYESNEIYQKALKIDSTSFKPLFFMGRNHADLGQHRKAVEYFNKANEQINDWHWVYNNRGNSLRRLGYFQKAREDFDKAISLNPNEPLLYINRGLLNLQVGRLDYSIIDYENGIKKGGKMIYYYLLLAETLSVKGNQNRLLELKEILFSKTNANYLSKGDKLILLYFMYVSSIIDENIILKEETMFEIKKCLKENYKIDWGFNYFNIEIKKLSLSESKNEQILNLQKKIIKNSKEHVNKIK